MVRINHQIMVSPFIQTCNKGTEYTDTVDLGSGLVIKNQSIGVADSVSFFPQSFHRFHRPFQAQGFDGVDGILG